jgi:copper chaperone NosL
MAVTGLMSCSTGPQKINIGKDACNFCKMSISDNKFGAEIITKKGKVYKFDDTHCLVGFFNAKTINKEDAKEIYLVDFDAPHELVPIGQTFLMESSQLRSPMGGNIAAFSSVEQLKIAAVTFSGKQITVEGLLK